MNQPSHIAPFNQLGAPQAQFLLGQLYAAEDGGRRDRARAYAWFRMCGEAGVDQCRKRASAVAKDLGADELSRSDAILEELRETIASARS